ncbi:MAG: CpaF family protein [Alphaproteobacteria bacterium]|jgi:pilus assembly protein CpaF|nr:CpaF family protein [Alphaproteobacteria bacterium]
MARFGNIDDPITDAPSFSKAPSSGKLTEENGLSLYQVKVSHMSPALAAFRDRLFERMVSQIDLATASRLSSQELRTQVERFTLDYAQETQTRLSHPEQQSVCEDIVNDMVGLGPLEVLIHDPNVTDILINAYDQVYVEHKGKLNLTNVRFRSDRHVLQVAQRIANFIGRRVDETSPMVDARLKDGSRVNVIIPPIALNGVSISIRKFSKTLIDLDKMCAQGNLSSGMRDFLKVVAKCRLNVIISGGTGSGKTTLLNAMSQLIDPRERIVTIEDSAELKLAQPHVVRLESRTANIEGIGEITIRDLVRNALRMRPDRIVVGECRGSEAFDMLQAMNTGHDGSMSTIHANNTAEALHRMENMILMTGHALPTSVIRSYIADAVNVIVHTSRMRDGKRRVTQITELCGLENDAIRHQDIFSFEYGDEEDHGQISGTFTCHCLTPHLLQRAKEFNLEQELLNSLRSEKG